VKLGDTTGYPERNLLGERKVLRPAEADWRSPEAGTASEELEVKYGGADLEIGFNSRYLLDIAAQREGETAQFVFADSASPTIVRDPADVPALYVIMPMRV
jgi:DNA polymerase-3 subunit beta